MWARDYFGLDKLREETERIKTEITPEGRCLMWNIIDGMKEQGEQLSQKIIFQIEEKQVNGRTVTILCYRQDEPELVLEYEYITQRFGSTGAVCCIDDGSRICTMMFLEEMNN